MIDLPDMPHISGFVTVVLNYLFGTVYGTVTNHAVDGVDFQDVTLLTKVLGYFNYAAVILTAIMAFYNLFAYIFKVSASEKFDNSGPIAIVIYALCIVLITPWSSAGNLSLSQTVTLRLVDQGISFGNGLWEKIVDEVVKVPKLNPSTPAASQAAENILRAEVCALGVAKQNGQYNTETSKIYDPTKGGAIPKLQADDVVTEITPFNSRKHSSFADVRVSDDVTKVQFGPNGKCGEITFVKSESSTNDFSKELMKKSSSAIRAPIQKLIANTQSIASKIVDVGGSRLSDSGAKEDINIAKQLVTAYKNSINVYVSDLNKAAAVAEKTGMPSEKFQKFLKSQGWGFAGVWWKQLSDLQNVFQRVVLEQNQAITAKNMPVCITEGVFRWLYGSRNCIAQQNYESYTRGLTTILEQTSDDIAQLDDTRGDIYLQTGLKNACNYASCDINSMNSIISSGIMKMIKNDSILSAFSFNDSLFKSTDFYQDSLLLISNFGEKLVNASLLIKTSAITLKSLGLSTSSVPIIGGIGKVVDFLGTYMLFMGEAIGLVGYMLGYALPLLPLLIWTLVLCGYFYMILEAVAAAPLTFALMLAQSKSFFDGQQIRIIMRLSALFLRPALYLLGLLSAYAIISIGVVIYNLMFFLGVTFNGVGPFFIIFVFGIYTYAVKTIITYCYSKISLMGDRILTMLGSGFGDVSSFGENDVVANIHQAQSGSSALYSGAEAHANRSKKEPKE